MPNILRFLFRDVNSLHADSRRRIAKSAGEAIGFMPGNGAFINDVINLLSF